ncbi:hypothetical protein DEJ32_15340 [Curtobacterium sp. MCPF17_046]|nr:hypothetical protein DEJ32_15340 [Curtobacterium sp. MCPF17_046]
MSEQLRLMKASSLSTSSDYFPLFPAAATESGDVFTAPGEYDQRPEPRSTDDGEMRIAPLLPPWLQMTRLI